jgi:hypothetical protein
MANEKIKGIVYMGVFLDDASIEKLIEEENKREGHLPKAPNGRIHCTFGFRPTNEDVLQFVDALGKVEPLALKVKGYGCDFKNSGFSVELSDEQKSVFKNDKDPHITVSLSQDGKAKDTGDLPFEELSEGEKFEVNGHVGIEVDVELDEVDEKGRKKLAKRIITDVEEIKAILQGRINLSNIGKNVKKNNSIPQ